MIIFIEFNGKISYFILGLKGTKLKGRKLIEMTSIFLIFAFDSKLYNQFGRHFYFKGFTKLTLSSVHFIKFADYSQ